MNFSKLAKPVVAVLLAVGVTAVGSAPAEAAPESARAIAQDTAWE